jgi:hypothetical protein
MKKLLVLFVTFSGLVSGSTFACCPGDCCGPVVTNNALSLLSKYDKSYVAINITQTAIVATTKEHKSIEQEKS